MYDMRKTNIIYLGILAFIVALLVALPIITVPISVSARGAIRPLDENTALMPLVSGRITQSYLYSNNQKISEGDTLLVIRSDALQSKASYQKQLYDDYSLQLSDLQKLITRKYSSLQTGEYQLEVASMREKIAEIQSQLTLAEKDLSRSELLWKEGIIPQSEYDQVYHRFQQLEAQKNTIEEQQQAQWHLQKRDIQRQLKSITSEVQQIQVESDYHTLLAPVGGRLINFSGVAVGAYLLQGQKIADISGEANLLAECTVPSSVIGFIKIGQSVRLQIDTYNHNQWGLADAVVKDIDNHIRINEQTGESYFSVKCELKQSYLQLKSGYRGDIVKGQTFTARFYLLDRTLWQLLFDKVDDWFNPKII